MGLLTQIDEKLSRWRGNSAEGAESTGGSDWSGILPQMLAAGLIAAALVLAVMRFTGLGTPELVAFDIIKYANAQRAVAARLLTGDAPEEVTPILLSLSDQTRQAIQDVAGPGTLVVIRQSVVQGELRDITDDVLRRLHLPTNVPTADPSSYVFDIAPTMLGGGPKLFSDVPDSQPAQNNKNLQLP